MTPSPLPWSAYTIHVGKFGIKDGIGNFVTPYTSIENADFIIRAVNSHAELVAFVGECASFDCVQCDTLGSNPCGTCLSCRARAVLAKVKT